MTTINLDVEEYNDFLRCLMNLREICNDVDIRDGIIRQRSNDLTSVFEMDLTPIINTAKIPITNLKKKLDLLKTFAGQAVSIEIEEGETESESHFVISDEQSSIKFQFPATEFMDNKIMSQDELDNIFNLNEDDMILSDSITSVITERIRIITLNFNTEAIQVRFEGDMASISAATQAKDQFAKFKTEVPTNIDFGGNYSSNLSTIPFGIEHDTELDFKMFKDPNQSVSLNKITTELGNITINIYSRSAIVEED